MYVMEASVLRGAEPTDDTLQVVPIEDTWGREIFGSGRESCEVAMKYRQIWSIWSEGYAKVRYVRFVRFVRAEIVEYISIVLRQAILSNTINKCVGGLN